MRRISVRSTEVETSERARVLIPNSYLITEKVKNWTLRDNLRRIVIPVCVAHGCDPREVKAILLKVAEDNPNVMATPAPSVELDDFNADSLQFKLYAFIDLSKGGGTGTDLRIAILDAFYEADIATPWGRTDATPRDAVAQNASNGKTSGNGAPRAWETPEQVATAAAVQRHNRNFAG